MAYLFVSDLHLDGAQPERVRDFVDFCSGPARGARALYVLGDLFETWLGDDLLDPARESVCRALRALSASGVPLFVMRGNRDFLFDAPFAALTGAELLSDPTVVELDGVATLLTHGDLLCTDDASYQQLRSLTQDALWRGRLTQLSARARSALAAIARAGSRRHMAQARPAIMDVNDATVAAVFTAAGVTRMIHGHTHRPAIHEHRVAGRPCTRIVLDAWYDGGSYLVIDEGRVESRRLRPAPPSETGTPHRVA